MDIDQVEDALRRAEELLAEDFDLLSYGAGAGMGMEEVGVEGVVGIDGARRDALRSRGGGHSVIYKDESSREKLINRLLVEREEGLIAARRADELAKEIEHKNTERRMARAIGESVGAGDASAPGVPGGAKYTLELDPGFIEWQRARQQEIKREQQDARSPTILGCQKKSNQKAEFSAAIKQMSSNAPAAPPLQNQQTLSSLPRATNSSSSSSSRRQRQQQQPSRTFSRKSLDQVKRQVELERSKDCTFRPKVNKRIGVGSAKKANAGSFTSSFKHEKTAERIMRLSRPRNEYWRKKHAEKLAMEERELEESCTFRPDISIGAKIVSESTAAEDAYTSGLVAFNTQEYTAENWKQRVKDAYRNHVPVEKRLHADASQRWEAREPAKCELEEADLQAQPFRPAVNVVSEEIVRQIDYEPIEQRFSRVSREKAERLAKRKLELEINDENLTFRPAISEQSVRIAEDSALRRGEAPCTDVVNRLLTRARGTADKQRARQHALAEREAHDFSFKPAGPSVNSRKLLKGNRHYKESVDFVTRQALLEEERKRRRQRKRAEVHDMAGVATFTPDIRSGGRQDPDSVLVQSRPERLAETSEQRFERLSKRDKLRKDKIQECIREHHYAQFDFKPRINKVSAEIVRETHKSGEELYNDLHQNERGKYYRSAARSAVEDDALKDCTFAPQTLEHPHAQASEVIRYSMGADPGDALKAIERKRREREVRMLQMKREQEYEELKECTFSPLVNEKVQNYASSKNGKPVMVRGLGRHLELRELASRMEEEKRERASKVFLEDATAIRPEPFTKPEPFNLSTPMPSKVRQQKYKGELSKNCTFRPKTNAAANRRAVGKVLAQA